MSRIYQLNLLNSTSRNDAMWHGEIHVEDGKYRVWIRFGPKRTPEDQRNVRVLDTEYSTPEAALAEVNKRARKKKQGDYRDAGSLDLIMAHKDELASSKAAKEGPKPAFLQARRPVHNSSRAGRFA